ncbi:polyprenyl synthetase family protein [Streptomyces poonensis]|uniref:Geranylgeranyl pyrophosphate synthase n=1 Tax=Streptomyces poonensis TaxID=68255 RepID=A0A918PDA0_9ACTN|nr:polyprenyl synthetase family protein [Streptomyces poonensis]GGY99564.1 geranylgeranyl pyrophosphate synthase [Streptomyces poonensis]GLJ93929.1 geranylgeranyl pyrophosphate synthase [Streptomyces poonensis]
MRSTEVTGERAQVRFPSDGDGLPVIGGPPVADADLPLPADLRGDPPFPVDVHDLPAVDADVPGAVGRVLARVLAGRVGRARATDAVFARDIAERVARFTLDGGKRTRSCFVWWGLRACGGADAASAEAALRIGAALELVQTCALVQDDVMDGARLRRGRPALHTDIAAQYAPVAPGAGGERFGEAAAILAGDLALAWAEDLVADTVLALAPDAARRVHGVWSAMRTEMVAGQYLDVQGGATSAHRGGTPPAHRTARALRAACLKSALYSVERPLALGAALAGADGATTRALTTAGRYAGLAFQLRDDLQDVFADPRRTGKPSGGDIRSGKPTYLVALARARAEASGDRRALAVLRRSLGRADLSGAQLARVREVLVGTGARDVVEARIERLAAQALRHLSTAVLDPVAEPHLRRLLCAAAGVPAGRGGTRAEPGPGRAGPAPLTVPAPGAGR